MPALPLISSVQRDLFGGRVTGTRAVAPPGRAHERRLVQALRTVTGECGVHELGLREGRSWSEAANAFSPPLADAARPGAMLAEVSAPRHVRPSIHAPVATSTPASAVASVLQVKGVWSADAMQMGAGDVVASGHVALDAELPGGGWPLGALIELLPHAGMEVPVWPLIGIALAARQRATGGTVVLVNPPHEPFLPALAAAGLKASQLLWVPGATTAAQLWASEQALRCAGVSAVLAWLPRARDSELRRLHAAALQAGDSLLFVVRSGAAAMEASCARLRLRVAAMAPAHGPEAGGVSDGSASQLRVELLKRRGPPLVTPLWLPAQGPALRALLAASAVPLSASAGAEVRSFQAVAAEPRHEEVGHALDRLAVAA